MTSYEIKSNIDLELNGKTLQVGEYISNGATANVFRGIYDGKEVAVKAIREGAIGGFYSEFEAEVRNLEMLYNKWKERFTSPQVVPALNGYDINSEYPFLVEEFIDGKKLDHAMRDLPEGVFSEQQALYLAAQIGRILVVLHNDIHKCYGDIKFGNFLIVGNVEDNPEPVLKIFDWNVLGYSSPRNIQKDLLIVSNYVLYMLTGELPQVDQDTLQVNPLPVGIKEFNRLTSGARHFMETALHPMLEHRFATSEEWLESAERLLGWWQEDPLVLLNSAKEDKGRGFRNSSLEHYHLALAKADISGKRNVEEARKLQEEIIEELSGDKVVKKIADMLWGSQHDVNGSLNYYNEAYGREQYRENEKVILWGWLAKAAKEIPRYWDYKDEFQNSLEERLNRNYKKAADGFSRLNELFPSVTPLSDLMNEANALLTLKGASEIKPENAGDIKSLEQTLITAQEYSSTIPQDLQKIAIGEWEIESRLSKVQENLMALTEAESLWKEAIKDEVESSQIKKIGNALDQTPIQAVILSQLKEVVYKNLDAGNYEYAERLANIPSLHGYGDDWFEGAVRTSRRLAVMMNDCQRLGGIPVKPIRDYLSISSNDMNDVNNFRLIFPSAFVSLMKEKFGAVLPQTLVDDELIQLDKMFKFLPSNFLEENSETEQIFKAVSTEWLRRIGTRKQKKDEINNFLNEMRKAREEFELLNKVEAISGNEMIAGVRVEKNRRILNMIENLSGLKMIDTELPDISEWTSWLESINLKIWVEIRAYVEERIRSNRDDLSFFINEALNTGNTAAVAILLNIVGPDIDEQVKTKSQEIHDFLAWSKKLPDEEDRAPEWLLKENIPLVYWKHKQGETPSASQYFEDKAKSILNDFSGKELTSLANAWWVYERSEGKVVKTVASWPDVKKASSKFLKDKRSSREEKEKVFLDTLACLESPKLSGKKPVSKDRYGKSLKIFVRALAVSLAIFLLLVVGINFVRVTWFTPTPTPVAVLPTDIPIIPLVEPEVPPTESPTEVPTEAPVVSYPDSQYPWKSDVIGAPVELLLGVDPLYLLDGEPAVKLFAEKPETWLIQEKAGINDSFKYANLHTKTASVEWLLDVPVKTSGLYAFYINDTKESSWTSQLVTYQLFVGEEANPRTPDFGQSNILLFRNEYQVQGGDWRCVGMYFLEPGDVPRVHLEVPTLIDSEAFAADALGIAFVPDVTPSLGQFIAYPNILYWADDAEVTYEPLEGAWADIAEPATWLGAHKLDLTPNQTAAVTWVFNEILSPGQYEVFAFIPAELSVNVSYDVLLKDSPKGKMDFLAGSGMEGTVQSLGKFEVTAVNSQPLAILTVKMISKAMETPGVFAYDNVFILPVAP